MTNCSGNTDSIPPRYVCVPSTMENGWEYLLVLEFPFNASKPEFLPSLILYMNIDHVMVKETSELKLILYAVKLRRSNT